MRLTRAEDLLSIAFVVFLSACMRPPMSRPVPSDGEDEILSAVEPPCPATATMAPEATEEMKRTPIRNAKLESSLVQLLNVYEERGLTEAQAFARAHQIVMEDDRVQVVIDTTPDTTPELLEAIDRLGGKPERHYKNLVQALVPLDALETLAARPDVKMIREPRRPSPSMP